MIKTDYFGTRRDGKLLFRTFSDCNKMILQEQTGMHLTEAIDVENCGFTYIELSEPIPIPEKEEDLNNES